MTSSEVLELRTSRGAHTTLTLKELLDGSNAGDSEICNGSVRPCRIDGQPAFEWMPVEAILAEHGNCAAGRSSGPTLPPPLLIRAEQRDRTQAPTQQVKGGTDIRAELPTIGRCLRWKERKWFEPQMQFTLKGKAGLLLEFEAAFMDLFRKRGYPGVEIFRAKESPDTPSRICRRFLKVSERLAGFKNAGAISEVTVETVGQDFQVSVFTYTFKRIILRELPKSLIWVVLYWGIAPKALGPSLEFLFSRELINLSFFVFGIEALWLFRNGEGYAMQQEFRNSHQRELLILQQAVESCIQQTVSLGRLGIAATDIYSPPHTKTPSI